MRLEMQFGLTIAAIAALATGVSAKPLPTASEGGARAAIQDVMGNSCPGVAPDYAMRAVLVAALKNKDPAGWASGYEKASREILSMLEEPVGRATVCDNALKLYGPSGTTVPKLLLKSE